ncbi:PilZ domain-containing protein [uncultured Sphingomonas sp.]|uniref:PilZ domain-containing protein n=1 Tax=uncultured Sphingomonas sp. TaxID=158754 RepID=UPI0025E602C8|nr:PilZ domain-containing protein [uncultured Sphingomonas sp.]
MAQSAQRIFHDDRAEHRDQVHWRARAFGPDARSLSLTIVNLSPHGLMARCDAPFVEGARIHLTLPVAGAIAGEVRWALGGRIGCRFDRGIDRATYYEMLAAILRP